MLNQSNDQSNVALKQIEHGSLREGVKVNDDAPLQMPGAGSIVDHSNDIPDF